MNEFKLYMLLLGCKPEGRHTEQHDVMFGIAKELRDLIPQILSFWPGPHKVHVDAWRTVTNVNGSAVSVCAKTKSEPHQSNNSHKLFFINLGGYKENAFDEFHYKMLVSAENKSVAISEAKQTAFFQHTRMKGAESHIDDKYGVDVDDMYEIQDILPAALKEQFIIDVRPGENGLAEDSIHLGYFKLDNL
jgi:hypothetical protein